MIILIKYFSLTGDMYLRYFLIVMCYFFIELWHFQPLLVLFVCLHLLNVSIAYMLILKHWSNDPKHVGFHQHSFMFIFTFIYLISNVKVNIVCLCVPRAEAHVTECHMTGRDAVLSSVSCSQTAAWWVTVLLLYSPSHTLKLTDHMRCLTPCL